MLSPNAVAALALIFIVGMVWLRTRMHYRRGSERLVLTPAGRVYFGALLGALALGFVAAPVLGQALWPNPVNTPLLTRVVCFLAIYYLFIPVHQALRSRGVAVFRSSVADPPAHQ
jgi:hypothetical protein